MLITVKQPSGRKAASTQPYTYVLSLSVDRVVPSSGSSSGGTVVTITGAGFTAAVPTQVTFGGVASPNVEVLDPVTLRATAPPHAPGVVNVVVTVGNASTTAGNAFAYAAETKKRRAVR